MQAADRLRQGHGNGPDLDLKTTKTKKHGKHQGNIYVYADGREELPTHEAYNLARAVQVSEGLRTLKFPYKLMGPDPRHLRMVRQLENKRRPHLDEGQPWLIGCLV